MEDGGLGACLFLLLRLSTDTFAAFSSAACWSTLVSGGDEVEKVEELRWMRNCSAMSLSSFLGRRLFYFVIFYLVIHEFGEEVLERRRSRKELAVTRKLGSSQKTWLGVQSAAVI